MTAYYNEFDPFAAQWLRNLITAGHIAPGIVDDRSISDVTASDLKGFTQCHFFAGIGGWSLALRLAGVPDSFNCWTGSPPCQPFSAAGKQLGQLDERHLAPTFMRLIAECRPPIIFGEQVAPAIGKHWLDDLFAELENETYACGAAVLPACSVGAPHKRDRLFFGAVLLENASSIGRGAGWIRHNCGYDGQQSAAASEDVGMADHGMQQRQGTMPESCLAGLDARGWHKATATTSGCGRCGLMADSDSQCVETSGQSGATGGRESSDLSTGSSMANSHHLRQQSGERRGGSRVCDIQRNDTRWSSENGTTNEVNGFWSDADWLFCRDGKFRPVESGTFPLAHGIPSRVGRLRGYGNAIVPQVASEFIVSFLAATAEAVQ